MTDKELLNSGKDFFTLASEGQWHPSRNRPQPATRLQQLLNAYSWATSHDVMDIVIENWAFLQSVGLLEDAFLNAWSINKHGTPNWDMKFSDFVFHNLNRNRLRKLSSPLPTDDPLTVYRGVAGTGEDQRRVRGYAWTTELEVAKKFADLRKHTYRLPNPTVYRATIAHEHTLAYLAGDEHRNEEEVLLLPEHLKNVQEYREK